MTTITDAERRSRLAHRHRLAPGSEAPSLTDAARSVVALHSSDPVTVYLGARRRMADASVGAVERALYEERSVVRHHAMRRTLWVMPRELVPVAHAAATVALVGPERRRTARWLVDSDVVTDEADAASWIDAGVAELDAELRRRGEATTRELGGALPHLTVPLVTAGGAAALGAIAAHTRLLTLMGFMGIASRARPTGSWINGQYRWAPTAAWMGSDIPILDPAAARASLASEYLRSFGPATSTDLQWWAGWTKGATSVALSAVDAEPCVLDDGSPAWVMRGDTRASEPTGPWVALLPSLDPTAMGWKQRAWYLDHRSVSELFDANGNAGPTVWADGRVVGGWAQRRNGDIAVGLSAPITERQRRLLDVEIDRVRTFIGDTRFSVRFPSPLSRRLAS